MCINFPNKFSFQEDVNHKDEIIKNNSKIIDIQDQLIESKERTIEIMKDKNEKNNELFNQATELIKRLIMRNEHMYKDIAKMQRIINTKNI